MTTDEQWLVNAATVQEKQATSYENAAFLGHYKHSSPNRQNAVKVLKVKSTAVAGIMSNGKVQSDDGGEITHRMLWLS